eukprot:UN07024
MPKNEYKKQEDDVNNNLAIHSNVKRVAEFEKRAYELDIIVADTLKKWSTECSNILQSIHNLYNKKEDELLQIYQVWTLNDFISYLKYVTNGKIQFSTVVITKFKLVGINGSSLSEISDSFLILAGINDSSDRKIIMNAITDLLNKYGGNKSKQICCICAINEINTVCVPCGHMVYCNSCGKKSFQHTNKCPICRKNVITLVTTFKSGMQ